MKTIAYALLIGATIPLQAMAQHDTNFDSNAYLLIGASYNDTEVDSLTTGINSDRDIGAIAAIGYSPNENFSFEANYQDFGTVSNEIPVSEFPEFAEAKAIGLSAITRFSITERNYVSLNLGVNQVKVERFETEGLYHQDKDTGISFGISYEFFLYKELSIGLDVKRFNADRFDSDASSLTFRYIFR